ncbi:energy-coupling factor transporter transmembrane component T [Oscillospiraceae bacterium MB08-C2-2]|nr:energy-coupling factor transporter transmembrane component T [Oscillospiraceae bacterium MB08-C2-2]
METARSYSHKFLHRLYPTTKLIYLLLFSVLVLLVPAWQYEYALFALMALLAAAGSHLGTFLKKVCHSVLLLMVLIFVLQSMFRSGTDVIFYIWIFSVKWEGIHFALRLCGILLVIASAFILYFQTTEVQDLILALEQMGVSPTVSYVILSTLQMIPQTKKRSEVIMDAQQSRGIETKGKLSTRLKAFIPMLAPLILSSFSGIEERALTLEARAFSAPCKKTNIRTLVHSRQDKILGFAGWAMMVCAVIARVLLWR